MITKNFNAFKEENLIWTMMKKIMIYFLLSLSLVFILSFALGYEYKLVASGSMTPKLRLHTLVMIQPIEYEDLKVGDIVTYKSTNTTGPIYYFTHRVVRIADNGNIITGGDANRDPETGIVKEDGEITENRVVGKVVADFYPVGELIWQFKEFPIHYVIMIAIVFFTYLIVI